MRSNVGIWWVISAFFTFAGILYTVWSVVDDPKIGWYAGMEWVGTIALFFTAIMAALIAFYLGRVHKAQGGTLPEDRLSAEVDDGDPELGHFSPWSWWPIVLAFAASIGILGLAVGSWMFPIGIGVFVIAIVGWVYEYYRGYHAH